MASRSVRLLGGAALCATAAGAVLLATDVVDQIGRWDVTAFKGLKALHLRPHVNGIAHRIVFMADPGPTIAALAAACLVCAWRGRRRQAAGAVLLVGAAAVSGLALKALLAHPRYQSLLGPNRLAVEAFPSGHAITAMSTVLAAVLLAPPRWRLVVAAVGAAYALASGVSLVIIAWHYPSDVLGGFLVAAAAALVAIALVGAGDGHRAALRTAWPLAMSDRAARRRLTVFGGGAALMALVLITHAEKLVDYAAANTTAVIATAGIALAAAVLIYGVAAEVEGS